MYKVFFNDRQIIVAQAAPESEEKPGVKVSLSGHLDALSAEVESFLSGNEKEEWLVYENVEELWQHFKNCFLLIRAAGGVVREDGKILFIFRRGKWDLPKGKVEKGESTKEAALREVEEECGISALSIVKQLPATWHIYQSPYRKSFGKWVLKETSWFEMSHLAPEKLKPQTEEDITGIKWVNPGCFEEILENTYPNLEQIIRLYL
jgi:ADP-ribose pyrophosphatase YjhB (NUDIX family)